MQGREDRSLGELFADLSRDTSALVRQEVALAKAEISEKASSVGKNVGFLAAGGAVAYAGFLAILAGIVFLLGEIIPLWLSALLVGAIVAGVGYFLVQKGLEALKHQDLVPRQTVQTIKEDQQWVKDQTK